MLTLHDVTYLHSDKTLLFSGLNLVVNKHDKIALIGNNGTGKSTLLKIMAGQLPVAGGHFNAGTTPYYVPQLVRQFENLTVAEALKIDDKLKALNAILDGNVTDENMTVLNDDWTIEDRCREAFAHWQLDGIDLNQLFSSLSGGQKTKVLLAGITIHRPEIVLLDEPSNHLDAGGRALQYQYLTNTKDTVVVVSHDRTLLNLLNKVCELSKNGITTYGGDYDFYAEQKSIEREALNQDVAGKEKALRKAKETARETLERQQKLDARGKKKQEKAGVPTIMMNTLRNSAEKSTSKIKGMHDEKISLIAGELSQLREALPDVDQMKVDLNSSALHRGKILVNAVGINFCYGDYPLWKNFINLQIKSGDRLVFKGANGSGKTTLIKIILGELKPSQGSMESHITNAVYIDQDYSLINNHLTVYEQAQQFNSGILQEHDIKIRLNRLLFDKDYWDKKCETLSGGEKMRLMLCCLTISAQAPDVIMLDDQPITWIFKTYRS